MSKLESSDDREISRRKLLVYGGFAAAAATVGSLVQCNKKNIAQWYAGLAGNSPKESEGRELYNLRQRAKEVFRRDLQKLVDYPEVIEEKREALLKDLWREEEPLPKNLPCTVVDLEYENEGDWPLSNMRKISRGSRFDIEDPVTVKGYPPFKYSDYFYQLDVQDKRRQNRLMIVHQGHGGIGVNGTKQAALEFLAQGFDVLFCVMPLTDPNNNPIYEPLNGHCQHSGMRVLESIDHNPLQYFFGHISTAIEQAKQKNGGDYKDISMTGISGGGWTTAHYATLDKQICNAFPVSGIMPHELWHNHCQTWAGNKDQSIYKKTSIHEMFVLAAIKDGVSPGVVIPMYNQFDPVCYPGKYGTAGPLMEVAPFVERLGGYFSVEIDMYSTQHQISPAHIETMLRVLSGKPFEE